MSIWQRNTITRRGFVAGAAGISASLAAAGTLSGCSQQPKEASKLAIIHTNDTHGHDLLDEESLGLAAVVQLKADYEEKGYEVLLLDAGDFAQGNVLVNRSRGDNAISFYNECGYKAMTLGNHEFDYGQDKIADYVAQADFPVISANIIVDATGETLVEPRTILTLGDGTKVGVFGLTTPETYTKANPLVVGGLTFLEGDKLYACAQEQVDALRKDGCALVVCLAHLGEDEGSSPNRAKDVIANTSGIDVLIDGHDHLEENQLLKNADGADTLVVETGCFTHAIGVITWEDGKPTETLVPFGSYDGQDAAVASYVKKVSDDVYAELDTVVATTDYLLNGERTPGVRTQETNLGDLVADAILWEAQQMADDTPDFALINGGTIRESIKPGDITLANILNVLPFIDRICTIQVTGHQLLETIEASCAATPDEMGAFPQVSGISFEVDTRVTYAQGDAYPESTFKAPAKPGSRVTIRDIDGRDFNLDETYTIATSEFICAGGDTYYVFAEAAQATRKSINYLVSDTLQYYLVEALGGEVTETYADAAGLGRIDVIV